MNFLAILAAIGLEQWRAFRWRAAAEQQFVHYARMVERKLNGGSAQLGVIATLVALAPPVLVSAAAFFALYAVHPVLGFAWNIIVLYLLMGFRRFSHSFSTVQEALKAGELSASRRALGAWLGGVTGEWSTHDVAKLAVERGLMDSYKQVFATLFWFLILPGPTGAVLYRAAAILAAEWSADISGAETTPMAQARQVFGRPARALLWLLDWIPVRLTALSFAIVGDFEDAVYCWRTQSKAWPNDAGGEHAGIIIASGAGALRIMLGGALPQTGGDTAQRPEMGLGEPPDADILPSAVGLVWRALILWLLLILLLTLANWAP